MQKEGPHFLNEKLIALNNPEKREIGIQTQELKGVESISRMKII